MLDSKGSKEEVANVINAIEKNNPALMQIANVVNYVLDKSFMGRQKSLIQALDHEGKKALLVGHLHIYKGYRDPEISRDGNQGRALVQEFLLKRNAVVLEAKPDAIQERLVKIQPIEDELLKLAKEIVNK